MQFRKRVAIALAASAAVAGSLAAVPIAAGAAGVAPVPVIPVHVTNNGIKVGANNTVPAGRSIFHVTTGKGVHQVNIVRLKKGYSLPQFGQDIGQALSGNVKAVNRVDRRTVLRGGTEAGPKNPGAFTANLPAGTFYFIDVNTNKFVAVRVVGKSTPRQSVPNGGTIGLYTYGFTTDRPALTRQGWVHLVNNADQPHFVQFQEVKESTTNAQVRHYFKSGARGNPSWGLRPNFGTGVMTQGQNSDVYLNLPAGKYLIACFWPDFKTGMPHAFMGMWKLIHLK
jgi:hypothetical protein